MSAVITASGPVIDSYNQVVSDLLNGTSVAPGFYSIYGPTIQVNSNSPDGEMIGLFALSKIDMENFGVAIYQSLDPDEAIGTALDNSGAFSGTPRKQGVYTEVVIQVTTNTTLNLSGLDTSTPFTVQDGNGNQYYLLLSASLINGVNNLNFRAANIGAIQVLANTITTAVTIVAGVVSVNNSSTPYVNGANQETDANYRLRLQSVRSYPSQGSVDGLYAGLNQCADIVNANVYENATAGVVNGIPANGIWVVVNGGTPAEIAQIIYNRRNMGCPMKGSQSYVITQANGQNVTMLWDEAVIQQLYIYGYVHSLTGGAVNIAAITAYIVANWTFKINQVADITTLDSLIQAAQSGVVASGLGVSVSGAYFFSNVAPSSQQNFFVLTAGNINLIQD